jgi:GT2 family glycosyltransferase
MKDTTIVIPAYKPVALLKECVDSIIKYSDLTKVDVLVVCNGSDRESAEYLVQLNNSAVKFIWYSDALGFTAAANIGLKHASTPYIILLNTDVVILNYMAPHAWVDMLIEPIRQNSNISVTCAADMYTLGKMYFPFFCVGLQKTLLEKYNYLDMAFSPGYGEDIDFCFKTVKDGYKLQLIGDRIHDKVNRRYVTSFPAYHKGQGSFGQEGLSLANRGHQIIASRYS